MENNKKHILVVDDDDRIRNLLKDYLTENNYIVSTAENADHAKDRLKYFKFDVIILDVMMPGQNGYDLTKEIKRQIKVPIILLTAKGEVENRIKGLELGAEDYISVGRRYHTLILDQVPKLNEERRNEAKRFVTLIDALYELKVNLVMAAETSPYEIYRGPTHDFEFERTISRLMEMQSDDYIDAAHSGRKP